MLAREGEIRAAQMRLLVAASGALTVTFALSFSTRVYIAGYATMIAAAAVELLFARRLPLWINAVTCLFDVTILAAMNVALVLSGHPLAVANSKAFFTVTVLMLSLTCLRQDARLSLLSGAMAIAQYASIVLWIVARHDLERATADRALFGTFTWAGQFTRFSLLAVATAINISIIHTSRRYWRDSVHDALTGLANRRYAETRLDEALATAHRTGHSLVIALADVDHFKQINDRFGHAAGDQVLRALADRFRHAFRSGDVIARFGGDEFFILFPDSDAAATIDRLAEFHAALTLSDPVHATISVGVATWPADGEDAGALLAAADERLYAAKSAGRNCIRIPGEERLIGRGVKSGVGVGLVSGVEE